jgi:hypothetical protein
LSTAEVNSNGVINESGLYRHAKSKAEAIVTNHPKFGTALANAFVAVGYERVGPVPKETESVPSVTPDPEHRPINKSNK